MNKPPLEVAQIVKPRIYKLADEARYISMSRIDAGKFMDDLVINSDVGGVLELHIPKAQVRHYIKDSVLNRYSKDKACEVLPDDLQSLVKKVFGASVSEIDKCKDVYLFRTVGDEGKYIVVSKGTFLKWETALRKSLLYIVSKPFSKKASSVQTMLVLYAQGKVIAPADKILLQKALDICNAKQCILGE